LQLLHQNPDRQDVAWFLGLDSEVLDQRVRWREIDNWIDQMVRPSRLR